VSIKEKGGPAKAKGKRKKARLSESPFSSYLFTFAFAPEIGAGDET
jgi:hypothetical protein